jgi:hypothetical protein
MIWIVMVHSRFYSPSGRVRPNANIPRTIPTARAVDCNMKEATN